MGDLPQIALYAMEPALRVQQLAEVPETLPDTVLDSGLNGRECKGPTSSAFHIRPGGYWCLRTAGRREAGQRKSMFIGEDKGGKVQLTKAYPATAQGQLAIIPSSIVVHCLLNSFCVGVLVLRPREKTEGKKWQEFPASG